MNIKVVLTGNLNSKVNSCPPFPGKERHLLREQIARISHSTEICPKGYYAMEDPENPDEENAKPICKVSEDFSWSDNNTAALASLEVWTHKNPNLLKCGRCTHKAPAGLEEEAADEYLEKAKEADPVVERFERPLNEDAPYPGLEVAWTSKVVGDTQ